ncbi:MAG: hypothetical protein IK016_01415 [Lachnospiraceae bacterium]|nr:hypothetical protein [Lachnospiraceae bacterium]
MDAGGLVCNGCGSSNVFFDAESRKLICNQCGKEEYYSRATLNKNGKVAFARDYAVSFFLKGDYSSARHYALDVLNVFKDNAPALFIIAYSDEFSQHRSGAVRDFFSEIIPIALEYDEVRDLQKLFLAGAYNLSDYEKDILVLVSKNMQSPEEAEELCAFLDKLCPYLIRRRTSMDFLNEEMADIYAQLAEHCGVPKTCYTLIKAIRENADSPYATNGFFLKSKTQFFYQNFVIPVGGIIERMSSPAYKDKIREAYNSQKSQFQADANN